MNLLDSTLCAEAWNTLMWIQSKPRRWVEVLWIKKLTQGINRHTKIVTVCIIHQSCSYKRSAENYNSALTKQADWLLRSESLACTVHWTISNDSAGNMYSPIELIIACTWSQVFHKFVWRMNRLHHTDHSWHIYWFHEDALHSVKCW